MSLPAHGPQAAQDRFETRILLLIWATAVLTSCLTYGLFTLSPDDPMRLVEVRDFLAGQNWFDLAQYRLDPPHGVVMHWSRLVDLPLAILIAAGKTVLPAALAEQVTMTMWPLALLLVFLAGTLQLRATSPVRRRRVSPSCSPCSWHQRCNISVPSPSITTTFN